MINWDTITTHENKKLTLNQIYIWQNLGFKPEQAEEWLNAKFPPCKVFFCSWLRDIKQYSPEIGIDANTLKIHNYEQEFSNNVPTKIWKAGIKSCNRESLTEAKKEYDKLIQNHKNSTSESPANSSETTTEKLEKDYKQQIKNLDKKIVDWKDKYKRAHFSSIVLMIMFTTFSFFLLFSFFKRSSKQTVI